MKFSPLVFLLLHIHYFCFYWNLDLLCFFCCTYTTFAEMYTSCVSFVVCTLLILTFIPLVFLLLHVYYFKCMPLVFLLLYVQYLYWHLYLLCFFCCMYTTFTEMYASCVSVVVCTLLILRFILLVFLLLHVHYFYWNLDLCFFCWMYTTFTEMYTSCISLPTASQPCIPRSTNSDSVLCVCNSTYCDTVPEMPALTPGMYAVYTSSRSGDRFNLTTAKVTSSASSGCKLKPVIFHL